MKITINELKKIIKEELAKAEKSRKKELGVTKEEEIVELDTSKKATLARIKQNRDKVKAAKEKEEKERDFEDAAAVERWKYKQKDKDRERYNKQKDFLKKKFGSRAAKAVLDRHAAGYAPLRHWAKKAGDDEDVSWEGERRARRRGMIGQPQEKEWEKIQKKWLKGRDKDEYKDWRIENPMAQMKEEGMKITKEELIEIIKEELTKAEKSRKKELEKELGDLKHK
tara:strand:- start:11167 stop:11841 length:675 start_codon:yes stop_codon:yes gene_type:complete